MAIPGPYVRRLSRPAPAPATSRSKLPRPLASLMEECLFKAPSARPSPANVRARLERVLEGPRLQGLAALQAANQAQTHREAEAARAAAMARTEAERRAALHDAACRLHGGIAAELLDAIRDSAPTARIARDRRGSGFLVTLGDAKLTVTEPTHRVERTWGAWEPPAFDVVSFAEVRLDVPMDRFEYTGGSHSLWYGDVQVAGEYGWFEVAFMASPLMSYRTRMAPVAVDPGEDAAKAVWSGMAEVQFAWPFTPLIRGELDDFINRWATWLALGSQDPTVVPELHAGAPNPRRVQAAP